MWERFQGLTLSLEFFFLFFLPPLLHTPIVDLPYKFSKYPSTFSKLFTKFLFPLHQYTSLCLFCTSELSKSYNRGGYNNFFCSPTLFCARIVVKNSIISKRNLCAVWEKAEKITLYYMLYAKCIFKKFWYVPSNFNKFSNKTKKLYFSGNASLT